MNYIKEINAFYDLMELEPFSASGLSLWHTLLHINNKARWAVEFTASSTILKLKSGLSESSFQRARKELVKRELIEIRSRGKNLAPAYRMTRLQIGYMESGNMMVEFEQEEDRQRAQEDVVDDHVEGQMEGEVKEQGSGKAEGQTGASVEVLHKQKETIQNDTLHQSDAVVFYQENFGVVSPFVSEDILAWIQDVGEELVMEAMKRALERGKSNWGYVKQILRSWVRKNIRTVEAARAEIVGSGRKRDSGRQFSSREVVPEWFLERKKRKQESSGLNVGAGILTERDGEEEDVAVMLERYLSGQPV